MNLKKEKRTPLKTFLMYLAGAVTAFYVGALIGACWIPGINLGQWLDNFNYYIIGEHHFIVGFTSASPKVIGFLEVSWVLMFLMYITKIEHPFKGEEYGSAKWGNARQFTFMYENKEKTPDVVVKVNFGDMKDREPAGGIYVNNKNYWIAEGVKINTDNDMTANLNMLIVGPPGSGKSFRLARPILSQLAGSFLVTDPKGELSKQCGQFFEDNGYEVLIMNVESEEAMKNSVHFNPFRYIRNESGIMSIAQTLMKATTPPDSESSGDQFFEQSAEVLLTALIYLMHYMMPQEKQNWKTFVELLESTTVKQGEKGTIENGENGIMDRFEKANKEWKNMIDPETGKPHTENLKGYVDIEKFYHGAAETTSSIVASLDAHCRYMKLKCVKELLSEDEIDITNSFGYMRKSSVCSTGKRILFIVTSEDKRYYDWIPSMVYSLFFEELYHLTAIDPSMDEELPHHLTFLMDEFANTTLPDSFVNRLSTMRSRNMSAVVIVQNLVQLKMKFPKSDMDKSLIGNMSIIEILGAPDQDSCEYLSKSFGTMTINKQTTSTSKGSNGSDSESEDVIQKPLFPAEEMFKMTKDGPAAIIVKGTDPLLEKKVAFQNSPLCPLLTRKKPYIYKPGKKQQKINDIKIRDNSLSMDVFICEGKKADEITEEYKEQNLEFLDLDEDSLEFLCYSQSQDGYVKEKRGITEEIFLKIKQREKKRAKEEKKNQLDFGDYTYQQQEVVIKLKNKGGFSYRQIHALDCLIKLDFSYEEISDFMNPCLDSVTLEESARQLAMARQNKNKDRKTT